MRIHVTLLIISFEFAVVLCNPNLVASFIRDSKEKRHTTKMWGEYLSGLTESEEFTACHWMKIQYFALGDFIPIWSYCTIVNDHREEEDHVDNS